MRKNGMAAALLAGAVLLTSLAYAVLYLVVEHGPVYDFMCRRGFYQHISLVLLFYGILLVLYRYVTFRKEVGALAMELPQFEITPEDAAKFAHKIPREYRSTIFGRRI